MYPELTNLASEDRVSDLRRDYFYRLATVGLWLALVLMVVHSILLFPSYQYVQGQITERSVALASLKSSLASSDESSLDARVAALTKRANALVALGASQSKSALIASILSVSHPGVTLTGFSLTPVSGKTPATIMVRGMASTRDSLRAYNLALTNASSVALVDLPVSAYASASDINFALTITLKP